jgi:hypothetical protein
MSENHTKPKKADHPMTPHEMCRLIQAENTNSWNWLYPAASECASCVIMTGGHPEMMANFCPRVIQRLEELEQTEQDEVEPPQPTAPPKTKKAPEESGK